MDFAAIITAIGGLVTAIVGIIIAARTSGAAAHKTDVETLQSTIGLLRQEINTYQLENKELRAELKCLDKKAGKLQDELDGLRRAKEATDIENGNLRSRVRELENKVAALEHELNQWRTGEKKKTGPIK
jgi:chromosome segregation ATPase